MTVTKWSQSTIDRAPKRVRDVLEKRFKNPMLIPLQVKAYDPAAEMTIVAVANAAVTDRSREIMPKDCWDLENYLKNPVILSSHIQWDALAVIGGATKIEPTDEGLNIEASLGNPAAGHALTNCQVEHRSLVAQGYLKALSVGFIPFEYEYDEKTEVLTYKRVELLEISLVAIPCQQDSLIEQVKRLPTGAPKSSTLPPVGSSKGQKSMDEELKGRLDALDSSVAALATKCDEIKAACEKLSAKEGDGENKPDETATEEAKALKAKVLALETENKGLCKALESVNAALKAKTV